MLARVAESTWDAWVAQEEGKQKGHSRILYDARIAPPDTDLSDPESLEKALRFVYDDCWWQDLRPIMDRIWKKNARVDDSRRKYLNWPTSVVDAWVTPMEWAALGNPQRKVEPGEEIAMFFDGSRSRDATALVGCCISDGHVFTLGAWEPDNTHTSEDVVPVAEVDSAVERAFRTYKVRGFFADVKEWEGFAKVTWPERYADQLDVMAVPSGKDPQSIAWDMRSHVYEFGVACELTESEIRDRAFTHDDSAVLARHVGNARRRPTRGVVTIGKESPDSPRKIDAAVAMVGARMVRRLVLAAGSSKRQRSGKVW